MSTTFELGQPEIARTLGVTVRQVTSVAIDLAGQGVIERTPVGFAQTWTLDQLRRLQVAAALAHAIPTDHTRQSHFQAAVRAVFANPELPEPKFWAIYTAEGVSYVLYNADVGQAVGDGAVVVPITELWPETGHHA